MKRDRCIVCGAKLYEKPIYVCKNMPAVSQNLPSIDDLDDDKPVNLELCQCMGCGLVQFNNEPVPYYRDSTRAGERCDVLIELRQKQYKHMIETYDLKGKKIVEIGAGKGGFLKTLKELSEYNIDEYGIEYNADFVDVARNVEGVNVQQGNPECADTKIDGAPFDAFTTFAYPARLVKPNDMMQCIYNNTTDEAVGLIMVPSMEHLLSSGGYYDITVDHIAYYDESSFKFFIQRNGFEVLECGQESGVYLYAYVKKRARYALYDVWHYTEQLSDNLYKTVKGETSKGKKIAAWCAGHFAFTTIAMSGIGQYIEYIIDNSPLKQGRYSPVSHVPIVDTSFYIANPVDIILILGPFYQAEIIKEIHALCGENMPIISVNSIGECRRVSK